jgi:hypothetical protein
MGARRVGILLVAFVAGLTGCADDEPPVVARGRWVEFATHRDDPVCAGTVAYLDGLIEAGFELLGETPPDDVFVRYEWFDPDDHPSLLATGHAQRIDGKIHIASNRLVHDHELVHAVHLHAWPTSARFMHEGLAVLLDPRRPLQQSFGWRSGVLLDDVITATSLDPVDYYDAWFLVSQIVFDHGFQGLRELWHEVPRGATAAEIRDAYTALFDRPLDALIEPYYGGEVLEEEFWVERGPCSMALCAGELTPWTGDVWSAAGPVGCENDPNAVGPMEHADSLGIGSVWRPHVIELQGDAPAAVGPTTPAPAGASYDWVPTGGAGALYEPCWLNCGNVTTGLIFPDQAARDWRSYPGRLRVEVLNEIDDLPPDPPSELNVHRNEP